MKPLLLSLSPNTEPDDTRLAWRTLFSPHLWQKNVFLIRKIEDKLSRRLRKKHTILTSSGRTALYHALKAYNIGSGDEVIIQAFTCLAVPSAIKWTGAKPIYADIDPANYNIDPAGLSGRINAQTRAIIIQHTFGLPADIFAIKKIADRHHLILIEDLAHTLGGSYQSQPLGSFADTAVLSFGRDKTISCVFGGAVATRSNQVAKRVRSAQKKLSSPPLWWNIQQLLHPILMSLIIPLYFSGALGKILLVASQKIGLLSKAVDAGEKKGGRPAFFRWPFSPALAPLLNNQLNKLDKFTDHRRRLTVIYINQLNHQSKWKNLTGSAACLRFPWRVNNNRSALSIARHSKMILGDWYTAPVAPLELKQAAISGYIPGSCPNAELAARQVINLPTNIKTSAGQAKEIVQWLKSLKPALPEGDFPLIKGD